MIPFECDFGAIIQICRLLDHICRAQFLAGNGLDSANTFQFT